MRTVNGYNIPTVTNTFNVYNKGNALIGMSSEITIPDFTAITEEMSGSGLLGKIQEAVMGHFDSQEMEIGFLNLDDDIFSFADPLEVVDLNLRASQQTLSKGGGNGRIQGNPHCSAGETKILQAGRAETGRSHECVRHAGNALHTD